MPQTLCTPLPVTCTLLMLTSKKEKFGFIIGNNFVYLKYHDGVTTVEHSKMFEGGTEEEIFAADLSVVPPRLSYLFNSPSHIYQYLSSRPQAIISLNQEILKFALQVNGKYHICQLVLKKLQLQRQSLLLRLRGYEIYIMTHELKEARRQRQREVQALSRQLKDATQSQEMQRIRLEKELEKLEMLKKQAGSKEGEKTLLEQSFLQKEEILMQIKTKEGVFVALDD